MSLVRIGSKLVFIRNCTMDNMFAAANRHHTDTFPTSDVCHCHFYRTVETNDGHCAGCSAMGACVEYAKNNGTIVCNELPAPAYSFFYLFCRYKYIPRPTSPVTTTDKCKYCIKNKHRMIHEPISHREECILITGNGRHHAWLIPLSVFDADDIDKINEPWYNISDICTLFSIDNGKYRKYRVKLPVRTHIDTPIVCVQSF